MTIRTILAIAALCSVLAASCFATSCCTLGCDDTLASQQATQLNTPN